jgi:hypothetical protein
VRRLLVTANIFLSSQIHVTLMIDAIRSSELSVLTRATRHNIPEDILHSHRCENLKSHIALLCFSQHSALVHNYYKPSLWPKTYIKTNNINEHKVCSRQELMLTIVTRFPNHWWANSCPTTRAIYCFLIADVFSGSTSRQGSLYVTRPQFSIAPTKFEELEKRTAK